MRLGTGETQPLFENAWGGVPSPAPPTPSWRQLFYTSLRPACMEAVGAMLLTYTVAMVSSSSALHPNTRAAAIGAVLAAVIYAGASISFHFNPVITLGLLMKREIGWIKSLVYIVAQVLGATLGAALAAGAAGWRAVHCLGQETPSQLWIVELAYSFALVFVVIQTTVVKPSTQTTDTTRYNPGFGLAIAAVVAAGAAVGAVTNPCVATGLGIVKGDFTGVWDLWSMPLIGASIAVVVSWFTPPADDAVVNDQGHLQASRQGLSTTAPQAAASFNRIANRAGPYVMEFVGTYMLVLSLALSLRKNPLESPALPVAAILLAMIYAGGCVSGAHFNPAVSLGVFLRHKRLSSVRKGLLYMLVQLTAGVLAAAAAARVGPHGEGLGYPAIPNQASAARAMAAEAVSALCLVLAVLSVSSGDKTHFSQTFGLAVGAALAAGVYTAGRVSGGIFNPAAATGLFSLYLKSQWMNLWPYWVGPIVGALVAVGLVTVVVEKAEGGMRMEELPAVIEGGGRRLGRR